MCTKCPFIFFLPYFLWTFLAFYLEVEFLPLFSSLSICIHLFFHVNYGLFFPSFLPFSLSLSILSSYHYSLLSLSPSADPGRSLMDFSVSILLDSSKNNSLSYLHRGVMYTKLRWFVMSYITLYGIEWVYHYAATRRL